MDSARLAQLLESALDWTSQVSDQALIDVVRHIEIEEEELEYLGFDREEYPFLYR